MIGIDRNHIPAEWLGTRGAVGVLAKSDRCDKHAEDQDEKHDIASVKGISFERRRSAGHHRDESPLPFSVPGNSQFSVGFSRWSITTTFTGAFAGSHHNDPSECLIGGRVQGECIGSYNWSKISRNSQAPDLLHTHSAPRTAPSANPRRV